MNIRIWGFLLVCLWGCTSQKQIPFTMMTVSMEQIQQPVAKAPEIAKPARETAPPAVVGPPATPAPVTTASAKETPAKTAPAKSPNTPQVLDELPEKITSIVHLKPGTYNIAQTLEIGAEGKLKLAAGTRLNFEECGIICYGVLQAQGTKDKPITMKGSEGWEWENITIWGEKAEGNFAHCKLSDGVGREIAILEDGTCRLQTGEGRTLLVGGMLLYGNNSKGTLKNCLLTSSYGNGAVAVVDVADVAMTGNEIQENEEGAVLCINSSPKIVDNRIADNKKYGIQCRGTSKPTISKNFLQNNFISILSLGQSEPQIVANKIEHNNYMGINMMGSGGGTIRNNTISHNKRAGIGCENESKPLIEGNSVSYNQVGIACTNNAQPLIRNNECNAHKIAGIGIFGPSTPTIEGNTISGANYGILITHNGAKPTIENNKFSRCKEQVFKKSKAPNAIDRK